MIERIQSDGEDRERDINDTGSDRNDKERGSVTKR